MTTIATPSRTTEYVSFSTIDDLVELAHQYDRDKHDHVMTPVFNGRTVVVDPDMAPVTIEDHATTLLCAGVSRRLGAGKPVPSSYFRWIDSDVFSFAMNRHIVDARNPQFMLRCHNDRLRAVVSERYPVFGDDGVFENTVMARAVKEITKGIKTGHRLVRPHVSRDKIVARVLFYDQQVRNDVYGLGWYIANSEIGDGAFEVGAIIKRGSCDNTIAFDTENTHVGMLADGEWRGGFKRIPHIGGTNKYLVALQELASAHGTAIEAAMVYLNSFLASQKIEIPDMEAELKKMAKAYGWDEELMVSVAIGTEGQANVFGLVNGITWAAHTHVADPIQGFEMEKIAGKLLVEATVTARTNESLGRGYRI